MYFLDSVEKVVMVAVWVVIICLIPGASNDENTLLRQGECTKSPDLG